MHFFFETYLYYAGKTEHCLEQILLLFLSGANTIVLHVIHIYGPWFGWALGCRIYRPSIAHRALLVFNGNRA
jgi:hypothetical protein